MGLDGRLRTEEPSSQPREDERVAGRDELVQRLAVAAGAQLAGVGEQAEQVLGGLLRGGHEGDPLPHDVADDACEQRVVGAPENERVDVGLQQRREVAASHPQQLVPPGHAVLDELDEPRTGHRQQLDVRRRREGVGVRAGGVGALRADHPDPVVARRPGGPAHSRADHLDDRHGIPLAGVVQDRCAGRVAGDDERLDAPVNDAIQARQAS